MCWKNHINNNINLVPGLESAFLSTRTGQEVSVKFCPIFCINAEFSGSYLSHQFRGKAIAFLSPPLSTFV